MKDFPRFVFTSPGMNVCNGGTYGEEIVQNEKDMASALEAGFYETLPEALEAVKKIEDIEAPKAKK